VTFLPTTQTDLSVVITVRNEAPGLDELHRELTDTLRAWGRSYEVIVVDDGSTDDGFPILARLQEGAPSPRRGGFSVQRVGSWCPRDPESRTAGAATES